MADDYLSDREQEEALRNWWRENWRWIIGGVVLGVGLLIGWHYWQQYRSQQAAKAGELHTQLQAAVQSGDLDKAQQLLGDLAANHDSSGYTQQARLLVAKSQVDAGKFDEAVPLLQAVAEDSKDAELAGVAKLRLARVLMQQEKYDEALQQLDAEKAGGFAAQVRELRGDALHAKGDASGARAEYAAALTAAGVDAQTDRTLLELKLQEVGGSDEPQPEPAVEAAGTSGGQP